MPSTNPLSSHFRRAQIHFRLPSGGKYWAEGSLDLPITGEIPILPMTNGDEITLKTPDALMNGSGLVTIIQSCCPNIVDAWKMPSVDVDALLIAIRIASYGQTMEIKGICPHCGEDHEYDIDLAVINDQVRCPDYSEPVKFEDLSIKLRPLLYFDRTQADLANYEEAQISKTLNDPLLDADKKNEIIKDSMRKILALNEKQLVDSTEYIMLPDGQKVSNSDHIREFYQKASGKVTKLIGKKLEKFIKDGAIPLIKLACTNEECKKSYSIPLEFDYSRFFA